MGNTDDLRLLVAPEPRSVGLARRAVAEFAERAGADGGAVAVAVSEAITNAILHAYPDGKGGEIEIVARLNHRFLHVTVSDDGRGIAPNPRSPGLGYGLSLVASLSDEMGISGSPQGGTSVRMRFALTG